MNREALVQLARRYGTPLYVYDGGLIQKRYAELYSFIKWPKLKILYAMKANSNFHILRLLMKKGAFIDAVSPAEALLALRAGFAPDSILYTANNITDEEMHEVRKLDVLMNIGSLSRLEKYGRAFPGTDVCLRFNPDVVAGEHKNVQTGGSLTKFGILLDDADRAKEIADAYNLRVVGLHEHTGSGISATEKVFESMDNLLGIAEPARFPHLEFIDFGGGFKVPYNPNEKRINYLSFGRGISGRFSRFCSKYGRKLWMYFEPGKYIVAEAGCLVVQANTLKNNNGRLIAGVNSGFNHLIRPLLYSAYHHIINLTNPKGAIKKYDVCGNLCETGDRFAEQREINEIREGDFLAVMNAGAYCYSMASLYNLRPLPVEVLICNRKSFVARKRLSSSELVEAIVKECGANDAHNSC